MADKLNSLIMALENTDTYDRENALIDLYIFLISQNSSLPKVENTFIFLEFPYFYPQSPVFIIIIINNFQKMPKI